MTSCLRLLLIFKHSWEKVFDHLDDQTWRKGVYNIKKMTLDKSQSQTRYKIINKLHMTPEVSDTTTVGTYFNLMW